MGKSGDVRGRGGGRADASVRDSGGARILIQPGSDHLLHSAGYLAVPDRAICEFRDRLAEARGKAQAESLRKTRRRDSRVSAARQRAIEEVSIDAI